MLREYTTQLCFDNTKQTLRFQVEDDGTKDSLWKDSGKDINAIRNSCTTGNEFFGKVIKYYLDLGFDRVL